jgi:GNAT superfamily N-acetyltransferase
MVNGAWNIRPAAIHDARAIAEVHVESWKTTYRGIFPEALLNGLSVETRESSWRDSLAECEPSSVTTLVGCDATRGNVVVFISGGKERTGQLSCDGELYAIYLLEEAQRKGLGSLLVRQFAQQLMTRGFGSMAVWVLALNPSRSFYEGLGGKLIEQRLIEREGQTFLEVAYGWRNLRLGRTI